MTFTFTVTFLIWLLSVAPESSLYSWFSNSIKTIQRDTHCWLERHKTSLLKSRKTLLYDAIISKSLGTILSSPLLLISGGWEKENKNKMASRWQKQSKQVLFTLLFPIIDNTSQDKSHKLWECWWLSWEVYLQVCTNVGIEPKAIAYRWFPLKAQCRILFWLYPFLT